MSAITKLSRTISSSPKTLGEICKNSDFYILIFTFDLMANQNPDTQDVKFLKKL